MRSEVYKRLGKVDLRPFFAMTDALAGLSISSLQMLDSVIGKEKVANPVVNPTGNGKSLAHFINSRQL